MSQSIQTTEENIVNHDLQFFFVFPSHNFFWRETKVFTRPVKVDNWTKYFKYNTYKEKMPFLAVHKRSSICFYLHRPRFSHFFHRKCKVLIWQKRTSKCLFLRRFILLSIKTIDLKLFHIWKKMN